MKTHRRVRLLVLAVLTLLVAWPAVQAGSWIVPAWAAGKKPTFRPVHLYWFMVKECPLIYRTEIIVPGGTDQATALLRTSGYAYVCVDGRQVFAWAPTPKTKKGPGIPADPNRVHAVDLTGALTPGPHAITVSAPAKGFVLDGGLYSGTKRLAPLATDASWTVTKLAPTTIVEDEPVMRQRYSGPKGPVAVAAIPNDELGDKAWAASEDALAKAHFTAFVRRARSDLDEIVWRLELLTKKGIAIVDGSAYGWGGPARLDPHVRSKADMLLRETSAAGWRPIMLRAVEVVGQLEKAKVEDAKALADMLPVIRGLRKELDRLRDGADALASRQFASDEAKALTLFSRQFAGPWPSRVEPKSPQVASVRAQMEKQLGHPLNHLNESRYDRLGWIDHPDLVDSDIRRWGIRVNPVTGPTQAGPARQWRRCFFSPDPKNTGLRELRWSIGYNIEGQWPRIDPNRSWTRDKRFAAHKGIAWYRTRIYVPAGWAGNEVTLSYAVAGAERVWVNDTEVTARAAGQRKRTCRLPASLVAFGAENFLAFRVQADGTERGLVSPIMMNCPALEGDAGKATPPVDVLATPLSPCVVLTPRTKVLEIHHAGTAEIWTGGSGLPFIVHPKGKLAGNPLGNWVLLRLVPTSKASSLRPILLVFQHRPASVVAGEGVTGVTLQEAGHRVIAVRPWAKATPELRQRDVSSLRVVSFWSRAALAVPVNFMSITRVAKKGESIDGISIRRVPRGPLLRHTVAYDYLETKDDWGTEPLKLAPLPALCSYAIDCTFPTLKLDREVEVFQDGGLVAPHRGIRGTDRLSYSYHVEPYPRFAGFTSWMFSPVDTGVLGNKRELELIAHTGANSYRPQHNYSDEMPPKHLDPGGGRTRVQCIVDYSSAVGVSYMNNIDQTLGPNHKQVREDYAAFIPKVYAHYEKIARQLLGRPFWAVAYDLINEPFDHKHQLYNPAMKELTRRVRAIDPVHLCYIEPCEAWGAIRKLDVVEPTGDPLTVYSFHDYNFRLKAAADRWPSLERDISSIYRLWFPAIRFQIQHGCCMHCGEFGGHHHPTDDSIAQTLLSNDFFRVFDQFGMHHNYYTGRDVYQRLADGSIRPSNVIRAYRAYFARPDFNVYYPRWKGHPKPRTRGANAAGGG